METEMQIKKLWFDNDKIFVETDKGEQLWQSLLWYRRLLRTGEQQRNNYRFSYSGIHWADIDEDISFASFYYPDREPTNT
jgi:hypothetical protein